MFNRVTEIKLRSDMEIIDTTCTRLPKNERQEFSERIIIPQLGSRAVGNQIGSVKERRDAFDRIKGSTPLDARKRVTKGPAQV